jgi:hypothetical protein
MKQADVVMNLILNPDVTLSNMFPEVMVFDGYMMGLRLHGWCCVEVDAAFVVFKYCGICYGLFKCSVTYHCYFLEH